MQTEIVLNPTANETKQYLRVATLASKSAHTFFYVGADLKCLQFLTESFRAGLAAETFESAKRQLQQASAAELDIIILDITAPDQDLTEFQSFLRNRGLDSIPVVLNQPRSSKPGLSHELIDDVIDLNNWQYDFSSKVSFLKRAKQYGEQKQAATRIRPATCYWKRAFDILVATVLLLLTAPIFLLIALAISLESRGPIFYNAKRAGRGFKIFRFYKFRTMEVNADKKIEALAHLNGYGADAKGPKFFKITNDPRITRVGRFLRNTSLDELPQLVNVLKGDMSLVGNRPLPLYEAATMTTNEFVERFMAPAGMTGLWQIMKRGKADMSVEERMSLDISYARKSNLLYDLWIMANTPKALMQKSDV